MPQSPDANLARRFETLFANSLARCLREVYTARVDVGAAVATTDWLLVVRIESFFVPPHSVTVRMTVDHPAAHHQVWSGFRDFSSSIGIPPIDHPDMQQMVDDLIEALGDYLIQAGEDEIGGDNPDRLFRSGLRGLFSLKPDRIAEADRVFARAHDIRPRGIYLSWRAQLRAIQLIEKQPIDKAATREECRQMFADALDLEPGNSTVLATLANSLRQFARDDALSLQLADRSVRANPANSVAWWALSAANAYVGNAEAAYRHARSARRIAVLSPHRFWWDIQASVSALTSGRTGQALRFAESAHTGNPMARPPLRYLIALYADRDDTEAAVRATEKLRRLEPDFTIDQLLHDASYPASLLHSAPKLNKDKLRALL